MSKAIDLFFAALNCLRNYAKWKQARAVAKAAVAIQHEPELTALYGELFRLQRRLFWEIHNKPTHHPAA